MKPIHFCKTNTTDVTPIVIIEYPVIHRVI